MYVGPALGSKLPITSTKLRSVTKKSRRLDKVEETPSPAEASFLPKIKSRKSVIEDQLSPPGEVSFKNENLIKESPRVVISPIKKAEIKKAEVKKATPKPKKTEAKKGTPKPKMPIAKPVLPKLSMAKA